MTHLIAPRLLTEALGFNQAAISVSTDADKKLTMSGIFVQGGVRNLNQRVYPIGEIASAVEAVNRQLTEGYSVMGELDHPEQLTINIDRVSHMITRMWMDGPNGMGTLQILPTPTGSIARTLIENGVKLGVSSRGSGNVDDSGRVSEFEIITVDIVAKPSAPAAYPIPVLEGAFGGRRGRITEDLARAVLHDPKAQRHLTAELRGLIEKLK